MMPSPRMERKAKWKSSHGNGKTFSSQKSKVAPIITLSGDEGDPLYHIRRLDRDCLRQKAISVRSSTRWIDTYKTPNGGLGVPFIDRLGRYTGLLCYKWSCDPRSLISTVVSTVSKRLVSYCRKHNSWRVVKGFLNSLVGAAAYYAFSKNNYFWDRILFFSRNLEKYGRQIHKLRVFFSSKWDDNKRFVYSQVIFQTNWLLFRAERPRDKSLFFSKAKSGTWRKPSDAPNRIQATNCMRDIAYAISLT
jgi:hypothetical protein